MILLAYYNRPKTVRLALESVKAQDYEDWELVVVDDSSVCPVDPIIKDVFGVDSRVKIFNTNDSDEEKIARGGSNFGRYWNDAVMQSSANVALMLCDDDALYPGYLKKINSFYARNHEIHYSYSHVSIFDPSVTESIELITDNFDHKLNKHTGLINPFHQVDASQVSWRISAFKVNNIKFPYPQTIALDASLFTQLFNMYGPCPFNGLVSQYKGWFHGQLGKRDFSYGKLEDSS